MSSTRAPLRLQGRAELEPTLEWANRQAYTLSQADDPARIAWGPKDLVLPTNRTVRVEDDILEVTTDWASGLTAHARSHSHFMSSTLTENGRELGSIRWEPEAQVLLWRFPGLTSARVDNDALKEIGGWPFQPDMAWMNIQAFAIKHYHSRLQTKAKASAAPTWFERLVSVVSPAVYAQDGCTGLHWLDYSTFRPCCDDHDRCFTKYGCSASSWYWPNQGWRCTACNGAVAVCFYFVMLDPH